MKVDPRAFGELSRGFDLSERVGILAGLSSIGQSFDRGLLPRTTSDQAIITGASATANYALTAFAHSVAQGLANKIVSRGRTDSQNRMPERLAIVAADTAVVAVGVAAQRLLSPSPNEPIARAWGRSAAWRLAVGGAAGIVVIGAEELLVRADPTESKWISRAIPVAAPLGMAVAALQLARGRRAMADQGVTHDAQNVPIEKDQVVATGKAIATAGVVAAGLVVVATGERLLAGGVAAGVRAGAPSAAILARPAGHLVSLGVLAGGALAGLNHVMKQAEQAGDAVEGAYATPPTSTFVSGGPGSNVSWDDIGREGRRFTTMALTTDEIEEVMQEPAKAPPIRIFVGLESAATTGERADLAMRELERVGAFERSLIVFASPTGTGYLNYVTAESLEYLTLGDCAMVAMQYSLRPSPLSLNRVGIGIEQNAALLQALKWRLEAIPENQRPRLAIFGESLGAQTAEDVFKDEGVSGLERAGIERGLFLGTPCATKFRERWLAHPETVDPDGRIVEVDNYEEFFDLPADVRSAARYVFLTHHNDSMPKFWFPLAVQAPAWMGPPETREPGLPRESRWRPYTTFLITFIDVKNAMHVIPGQFVANGHDYRLDLARFTSLAYQLPIDSAKLERVEKALRDRELKWAERRLFTEQMGNVEAKVRDQLEAWGVSTEGIPAVIKRVGDQEADPYAASPSLVS